MADPVTDVSVSWDSTEYGNHGSYGVPEKQRVITDAKLPATLLGTLDEFRQSDLYTDMRIQTPRGDVTAHRLVMAAVSKTVAMSDQKSKTYDLSTHNGPTCKTNHSCLRTVVDFAYTGTAHITLENVEGVLSLAVHFQIAQLVQPCQEFIVSHMSEPTMLRFLNYACGYPLDVIKQHAFFFIKRNFHRLSTGPRPRLLELKALALSEFLTWDQYSKRHKEDKLEMVLRYVYSQKHVDMADELDLAQPVKHLTSSLSDKQLGRCLSKFPTLISNESVEKFLFKAGICLKKESPDSVHTIVTTKSSETYDNILQTDTTQNKHDAYLRGTPKDQPQFSAVGYNSVQTYPTRNPSGDVPSYVFKSSNKDSDSELKRTVKSPRSKSYIGKSPKCTSPRHTRRCWSNYFSNTPPAVMADGFPRTAYADSGPEVDISQNKRYDVTTDDGRYRDKRRSRRRSVVISSSPQRGGDSIFWTDSVRLADEGFLNTPDLSQRPDRRIRLGEISIYYRHLADGSRVVGSLMMTYFRRNSPSSFHAARKVGVVPADIQPHHVVRLAHGEAITGVSLRVSSVIHNVSFHLHSNITLGPFGNMQGHSSQGHTVRVEAPDSRHELYSIHSDTRRRDGVDVIANVVFRWMCRK